MQPIFYRGIPGPGEDRHKVYSSISGCAVSEHGTVVHRLYVVYWRSMPHPIDQLLPQGLT